jgi:hypothetical protein
MKRLRILHPALQLIDQPDCSLTMYGAALACVTASVTSLSFACLHLLPPAPLQPNQT